MMSFLPVLLLLSVLMVGVQSMESRQPLSAGLLPEDLEKLNKRNEDDIQWSGDVSKLGSRLSRGLGRFGRELPNSGGGAVAFSARFAHDNRDNGIQLGHHSILRFDDVITNIGHGYNPQTGIFTAPVSGVYVFFLTTMAVHHRGDIYLAIDKEGTVLDTVFASATYRHDQGSTQITTHMATGQKVWIRQSRGSVVRGDTWTVFTGYLLHAD